MITLKDVTVCFDEMRVLDVRSLQIGDGVKLAVTGSSGSGKTTLISVLCGLERISSGSVMWDGIGLQDLSEIQKDRFRGENVGFVMQDFHLYAGLSALQNVLLPIKFRYLKVPEKLTNRALYLLDRLGIKRWSQSVDTLSRGEKQRVAIARALINSPKVIIADEPTASLDMQNGMRAASLLISLADEFKASLICATHEPFLIEKLTYRLDLEKGKSVEGSFV
ncbi:MAG: ATP-binding cassette domain-containing protein [Campylobacteraceae bacterium]|jgi:putative ABC transport system ATP-binding protein|nr:ATP-binding cassette domain-containing protein [Campylobacteraceae bacterium]